MNSSCVHDFLNPKTTLVVSPLRRVTWCLECGTNRPLTTMGDGEKAKALMIFSGNEVLYRGIPG